MVIAHAGFSCPHPLWLASLRPNGRLLLPLTGKDREGTVIKITRQGSLFEAEAVRRIKIFPGPGPRHLFARSRRHGLVGACTRARPAAIS